MLWKIFMYEKVHYQSDNQSINYSMLVFAYFLHYYYYRYCIR